MVEPNASDIVVASVPSGHVYVRHVAPESGGPIRLPDPDPADPRRSADQTWWPPVMLEPAWAAAAAYDVFHLQFGFDAAPVEQLSKLVRTVKSRGRPFVYTVHDLRNPHHRHRELHDEQLDVLVSEADAVVTLTPGAAAEIEARWGRRAVVIPHPHVVDLRTMAIAQDCRARRRTAAFRVGVHVKSLRASMDPLRLLPDLVETVRSLPDVVLQVNGYRDVLDRDGARRDEQLADYLVGAASGGALRLEVHDYLSDWDLWCYLSSLDVSVLPYRFGTHSGWLEACRDLGTTVIAPTCGYFADQGPVLTYVHDEETYDPSTLVAAVVEAYETRPRWGAGVTERREQRRRVADAHAELYLGLMEGADPSCASA
jgi:glycosyltransferase involved in cell wall biosynthesis